MFLTLNQVVVTNTYSNFPNRACALMYYVHIVYFIKGSQDINGGFAFSILVGILMEHFVKGSAPLRLW